MAKIRGKPLSCEKCRLYECPMIKYPRANTKPDIVFLTSFPVETDVKVAPFHSRAGQIVKNLVREILATFDKDKRPVIEYMYALKCVPDAPGVGFKPTKQEFDNCKQYLAVQLDQWQPKLIVTLGAAALKALGVTMNPNNVRGSFMNIHFIDTQYRVLHTLHPFQVQAETGFFPVLKTDILKALQEVTEGFDAEAFDINTPTEFDDVSTTLDQCIQYADDYVKKNKKGKPKVTLAIDTETTSLHPYVREDRMIAVSGSIEEDAGFAFPWMHRDSPFTGEQLDTLRSKLEKLLTHPGVFLAMHNAKFDQQWLRYHEGLNLHQTSWDTLLVEHQLDEGKKGEYSLKDLTSDYFPAAGKYEKELQDCLATLKSERARENSERINNFKDELRSVYLEYWIGLDEQERRNLAAQFYSRGWLSVSEASTLSEVKYKRISKKARESGKEIKPSVTKSFAEKAFKLFKKIGLENLDVQHNLTEPEPLPDITFEDVPIKTMLKYAAIDAIMTRKIMRKQHARLAHDKIMLEEAAANEEVKKIPTKSLTWARIHLSNPLCESITNMEYQGVHLDREKARTYIDILDDKIEMVKDRLLTRVGHEFTMSGPSLVKVMYNELKYPVLKRSEKTGEPSTDAETILFLADDFPDDIFLKDLLSYRRMDKVRGTYLSSWLKKSAYDGRLHASFNQNGTATYRLSSSNPNLQNVPYQLEDKSLDLKLNLKELFIPDSEEFDLYDLDISNAEMRILCAYSKDSTLIKAFLDGMDLHSLTASGISDLSYEDIRANKEDKNTEHYRVRQIGKKVNELAFYKAA